MTRLNYTTSILVVAAMALLLPAVPVPGSGHDTVSLWGAAMAGDDDSGRGRGRGRGGDDDDDDDDDDNSGSGSSNSGSGSSNSGSGSSNSGSGSSGSGSGSSGSGSGSSGSGSGSSGGQQGGAASGGGNYAIDRSRIRRIDSSQSFITIWYASGDVESINQGIYSIVDASGRTRERRAAFASELRRMRQLADAVSVKNVVNKRASDAAPTVTRRGDNVEVQHGSGWRETISGGTYSLTDPNLNTVVRRPATAADRKRLDGFH